MIKLNDNTIFIGQIKQLLKEFNLPNCYVKNPFTLTDIPENQLYIEGSNFYFKDEQSHTGIVSNYTFNKYYRNLTTNLKIDNLLYDRYTHRYLGNYLRFLRAYKDIDLMCMYNCFDQETKVDKISISVSGKTVTFGQLNSPYITYKIPIEKLSSRMFSIYLQSTLPIETIISIEDQNNTILLTQSYNKFVVTKNHLLNLNDIFLSNDDLKNGLRNNSRIYLLAKIPANIKSSITFLDGDYISSRYIKDHISDASSNRQDIEGFYKYSYNINPQLASYENTDNYLLSDKLIQYLTDNAITPMSKDYNIKKMQNSLYKIFIANPQKVLPKDFESLSYNISGYWNELDTEIIKQLMLDKLFLNKNRIALQSNNQYYDRLPYIDKDLENILITYIDEYEAKNFGV